jgi:lipopolysaccharide export LptBFGC system permease protein LptF
MVSYSLRASYTQAIRQSNNQTIKQSNNQTNKSTQTNPHKQSNNQTHNKSTHTIKEVIVVKPSKVVSLLQSVKVKQLIVGSPTLEGGFRQRQIRMNGKTITYKLQTNQTFVFVFFVCSFCLCVLFFCFLKNTYTHTPVPLRMTGGTMVSANFRLLKSLGPKRNGKTK